MGGDGLANRTPRGAGLAPFRSRYAHGACQTCRDISRLARGIGRPIAAGLSATTGKAPWIGRYRSHKVMTNVGTDRSQLSNMAERARTEIGAETHG